MNLLWNMAVLGFGSLLLYVMAQLGGVAIELLLLDLAAVEEMVIADAASVKVESLMKHHGVQFFDWNEARQEYGFWRHGKWCPAVSEKKHKPTRKKGGKR